MPIYEYQCSHCEHLLEALQKVSDAPLAECPVCHKATLTKLVSAASFRLKGGGWYETDFKTDKRKQLADSGSDSGKEDKSGDGGDAGKSGDSGKSTEKSSATSNTNASNTTSKSGGENTTPAKSQ